MTPELRLEGRGHLTATVSWQTVEQPELFELAIGEYAAGVEAATVIPVADSLRSYTFTDLEPGVMLGVWVRKGCRYTTPGYDTIAYSDWSHPVGFMALGLDEVGDGPDFTVSPNPAHGAVQATLPEAALGGRLTLCDLAGRELAAQTVAGTTARFDIGTLPAGVYLVKLVTPAGISTRRLVVE